jgi:hypothetical protein
MGEFYFEHKRSIRVILIMALIAYVLSMLFYPFYSAEGCIGGKWLNVQKVWDRWQTFNVGVIALFSSVLALESTIYNENKQRQRNFQAAKAFLPDALSELITYYKWSAKIYAQVWSATDEQFYKLQELSTNLPVAYKVIFADCIRYAEPEFAQYLANILALLQIHNSRLATYYAGAFYQVDRNKVFLISNIINLAELQALTSRLFDFARGDEDFNNDKLTIDNFRNAYHNLNIIIENYIVNETTSLEAGTEKRVNKNS